MGYHQRAELARGRECAANAVVEERNDDKASQQGRQKDGAGDFVLDLPALFLGFGNDDPDGLIGGGGLYALGHHS